jgi:hypothetical protein
LGDVVVVVGEFLRESEERKGIKKERKKKKRLEEEYKSREDVTTPTRKCRSQ